MTPNEGTALESAASIKGMAAALRKAGGTVDVETICEFLDAMVALLETIGRPSEASGLPVIQEVVIRGQRAFVLGIPAPEHDCDQMDCSSIDHKLAVVPWRDANLPPGHPDEPSEDARDAERYRWLREWRQRWEIRYWTGSWWDSLTVEGLDRKIDEGMRPVTKEIGHE